MPLPSRDVLLQRVAAIPAERTFASTEAAAFVGQKYNTVRGILSREPELFRGEESPERVGAKKYNEISIKALGLYYILGSVGFGYPGPMRISFLKNIGVEELWEYYCDSEDALATFVRQYTPDTK